MLTVARVIDDLGGPTKFGRLCGFDTNPGARGWDMKRRGSIPPSYWTRIVSAASEAGKPDITFAALAELHAAPASPVPTQPDMAGAAP